MTEAEAQAWIVTQFGTGARDRLAHLIALVSEESQRQNLVAASTIDRIWARHIVDSAQLMTLAQGRTGLWLDIGTGAGFPGLVIALLRPGPMLLVEPRRKRADFLGRAIAALDVSDHTLVRAETVEALTETASIISARAVTTLDHLFSKAIDCAASDTLWLLPKGRNARDEVALARKAWHGVFHVEQSITDPASLIVLASEVSRR